MGPLAMSGGVEGALAVLCQGPASCRKISPRFGYTAAAMIKLTFCLRRKPGLTWDEFSDYWRNVHAPLVRERAEVLGIRRYVQVRTLQQRTLMASLQARNGGAPEPFDGIAELWYDELGGQRTPESVEAGRVLLEDERNFIDLPASPMWFGDEWEVYPGQ